MIGGKRRFSIPRKRKSRGLNQNHLKKLKTKYENRITHLKCRTDWSDVSLGFLWGIAVAVLVFLFFIDRNCY